MGGLPPGGRPSGRRSRPGRMRVLLVDMPFASTRGPALGLSMLKAVLERSGDDCDVTYPNVSFAIMLGLERYERIAQGLPYTSLAGEWVFSDCLYYEGHRPPAGYVDDVLIAQWALDDADRNLVLEARALAPRFLDECLAAIPWGDYDVLGFTSTCAQNLAALSLARRVKERHPRLAVVFGGSNWDEGMGAELHRRFPFVDFACSGEAEDSLPMLVRHLRAPQGSDLSEIPGLLYRRRGTSVKGRPAAPVLDLDRLPYPDHDDYLAVLRGNRLGRVIRPTVLMETCRGCWWAARRPCRFCASPGCRRPYREKSPERILREVRALAPYGSGGSIELVDDVPPPAFFDEVLPRLVEDGLAARLFCEVRPEAAHEHIRLLGCLDATVQPGIESLDDHVLRLIHKGSRALENIRLLLWCRTYGVHAFWNLIYGFPGETEADYRRMQRLLPAIRFLEPPGTCTPLRLDRFSQYAEHATEFGLRDVRPLLAYRYLYPFPTASLRRIAYSFEYTQARDAELTAAVAQVQQQVAEWRSDPETGAPRLCRDPKDSCYIVDTRADATAALRRLDPLEACVYSAAADIRSRRQLLAAASAAFPDRDDVPAKVDTALRSFVAERLMLEDGDRYLSLALPADGEDAL
jgi:ribosomal peptide maturation radical SAM protein 1